MINPKGKENRHAKKAAKEGGTVAGLAVLLAALLASVRAEHPALPLDPSHDAAVVGATTGILIGLFRWLRKLIKRRRRKTPT